MRSRWYESREAAAAHLHRRVEPPVGDDVTDGSGRRDALHQRRSGQVVAADADQLRLIAGRVEQLSHGGVSQQRAEEAVEHARRTTALHVTEDRDPGVLAEALLEHALDVTGGDRLAVPVAGALGDQHDVGPPADLPAGPQHRAHRLLPVVTGRVLGDEHEVGARRQTPHQRQIATAPAHHLDDERALMARRRALDRVDRLDDAMQGRVGADRHVGAEHVVVDRADQADQGELPVSVGLRLGHVAGGDELVEQPGPLAAQLGGAAEAAVTADHHQRVDATLDEVAGGPPQAVTGSEGRAAGGAEHRATSVEDAADVDRRHRTDPLAAVDQALQPLEHGERLEIGGERSPHRGAHRCVHPGGITTTREHRQPRRRGDGTDRRRRSDQTSGHTGATMSQHSAMLTLAGPAPHNGNRRRRHEPTRRVAQDVDALDRLHVFVPGLVTPDGG